MVIKGGQTSTEELYVVERGNLKLKLSGLLSKKLLPEHEKRGGNLGTPEV